MTDPIYFTLAALALLGAPGPTNTLLATAGATTGIRHALPLLAAELVAYALAILAIRLLLAPVMVSFPLLAALLKIAVALVLAYTALRLWRGAGSGADTAPVTNGSLFVATLLNPKAAVLAVGVFPAASDQLALLAAIFAALVPMTGFCWIVAGRLLSRAAGPGREGALKRIASVVLLAFAGLIAAAAFG